MEKHITNDLINKFSKAYNKNPLNKIVENAIVENGLERTCIDRSIIEDNLPVFNIELPDSKRYDQEGNHKCWIYSGLNLVKYDMAKNLNIDLRSFALSNSYIAFFDKLEKANNSYENIINLKKNDWEYIDSQNFLQVCVKEGGHWQWFLSIVNKYGLIPYEHMPDSYESLRVGTISTLYLDKVKKDCVKLLSAKKSGKNKTELRAMKENCLQENYILLSKIFGEPKQTFDYEYRDRDGNYKQLKNITPLDFKNKFLTMNLNDFVSVANLPRHNKKYYKVYREKYLGNVYQNSYVEFLNLPAEELKELCLKQLKDLLPVYIRINLTKFRSIKYGILDTRLYNYRKTLGIDFLTKEEALNTNDIYPHHCMTICGANVENNRVKRWKLEDSYGIYKNEKINGCYVMNDNYFNEFVLQAIIHKKYLSNEQKEYLKQKPIEFETTDPF